MGSGDGDKPGNWSAKQEAAFQALESGERPPPQPPAHHAASAEHPPQRDNEPSRRRLSWVARIGIFAALLVALTVARNVSDTNEAQHDRHGASDPVVGKRPRRRRRPS